MQSFNFTHDQYTSECTITFDRKKQIRKPKHGCKAKRGQPLGGRGGRAYKAR
jgi:hypothetical protein